MIYEALIIEAVSSLTVILLLVPNAYPPPLVNCNELEIEPPVKA